MLLEQSLAYLPISRERQSIPFLGGDLESLSASVFYTGKGHKIVITHGGKGMKDINRDTGLAYHIFDDGGSHIDDKDGSKKEIKPVGGSNPKGYGSTW